MMATGKRSDVMDGTLAREQELLQLSENVKELNWQSRAETGLLDRHMMQEIFFQCVEGTLKKK